MGHIDFECVELGRARLPLRFPQFAPPCLRPLSGESRGLRLEGRASESYRTIFPANERSYHCLASSGRIFPEPYFNYQSFCQIVFAGMSACQSHKASHRSPQNRVHVAVEAQLLRSRFRFH